MHIREETSEDVFAVRELITAAFGGTMEAELVDSIRQRGVHIISLVAVQDEDVVGYVLFSPVHIETRHELPVMGLGPVAVLPFFQKQGIGRALIKAGLEKCYVGGEKAVVVLGDAAYYTRFGFKPAHSFGIKSIYEAPPENFMVMELEENTLAGVTGIARYQQEFEEF